MIILVTAFTQVAKLVQMDLKKISPAFLTFSILLCPSCQDNKEHTEADISEDVDIMVDVTSRLEEMISSRKTIFYGIYSPVEMSAFFEQYQIGFDPSVLHPSDMANQYVLTDKIALNIGVYGADLSYIKLFDQPQEAIRYYLTIGKLSRQLGIPDELIRTPADDYLQNIDDPDKLVNIATTTYVATEQFLNRNDREHAAVLMLAGGWVEAMYIATHALCDSDGPREEVTERIVAQKYSLNMLIAMMQNHAHHESVARYLHLLNVLKKYFDQFDIYFEKDDVKIDTASRSIISSRSYVDISAGIVENIKRVVAGIRYVITG